MSASTVSITANTATTTRRTPVLAKEKRSNLDYTPTESLGNGAVGDAAGTNKASIRAEAIIERSHVHETGPVSRKSGSGGTEINTTTAQRRTRKVAVPKPEKARWKRVVRIFAKQLGVLLILAGLIQITRKVILNSWPTSSPIFSSETEMAFSELERRIAEVDGIVKTTTSSMQVQVELLDKKMVSQVKSLRQEIDITSSAFQNELKMVESRTESLQKSVDEVNAKPWVSKDELNRVYEELKKGKVDDSALSEINIDQFRAYARDIVEKEIEKHAADGLGRVDYAVASGGGFVMKHSDPYLVGKVRNWLPTSIRRVHSNAMKMLSPSFGEPGQCFALKGSNGYVQIRIRGPIVLEAVTLEHVAKSVAYDRSSAPKDCRVSGWLQEDDPLESSVETEKQLLREFIYDLDKSNAQTFNVLDSSRSNLVDTVRLDFTSNHGSNSHTCIYRFRVHGHTPDPPVSVMA